jgi:endonuclease-3 related protein
MLKKIYQKLYASFGPQDWWPGETPFEVVIGAILTQQTSWENVEKVIKNLKAENLLDPKKLSNVKDQKLERLIRSSGYYRQKTKKIKNFLDFLWGSYNGNLKKLFGNPALRLREELLSVKGIGKETADSIILYAAEKPIFVIDAYTKRVLQRVGITKEKDYDKLQKFFQENLPEDVYLFNEYHALIVRLGKDYCKKKPKCNLCPLNEMCDYANRGSLSGE